MKLTKKPEKAVKPGDLRSRRSDSPRTWIISHMSSSRPNSDRDRPYSVSLDLPVSHLRIRIVRQLQFTIDDRLFFLAESTVTLTGMVIFILRGLLRLGYRYRVP